MSAADRDAPSPRSPSLATTEVAPAEDTGGVVGAALAGARPSMPAGAILAQAAAATRLFGTSAPGVLGRFRVLDRIGEGAMGVVYSAYDPDLDRAVALKLVHVPARGRDAALAEAKALARLSHPNVVPVHDVGIEGDHLYIVMELVRGATLRAWVKGRDRRHILDAYRQAGQALAAAHASGLVHRDFKPDNAIAGSDERVRVVDFGLACAVSDEGRPVAGTPRYMAPEQAASEPVTPAADQYSFCVSLAEALGTEPLPRWLAAVLERGRAREPAARFESMSDLLRALARDPRRVWRLRIAIASAVLVCAAAFVVGRASSTAGADACSGGEEQLAAGWPAASRAATLERLASLGPRGRDVATRLALRLDEFAARWTAGHRDACKAHRRGESDALFDRRMACLTRRLAPRAELARIAGTAGANSLEGLAVAANELPDPDACANTAALVAGVEPPPPRIARDVAEIGDGLDRARMQIAAGLASQAHVRAIALVADARRVEYAPVEAEALVVQGFARMSMPGRDQAVPVLIEATSAAFAAGGDTLAVEAYARRVWVQGTTGDPAKALEDVDLAKSMAERTTVSPFARALLYNNIGSVELGRSEMERARAAFDRARKEARGLTGAGEAELASLVGNLALATPDWDRRDALHAEAAAALTSAYGEDHRKTLWLRWTQARMTRRLALAVVRLLAVCERYEAQDGYREFARNCYRDLGLLRHEAGDDDGAVAALERAVHLDVEGASGEAAGYLHLVRGDPLGGALLALQLAAYEEIPATAAWMRYDRGRLELGLGRAWRAAGELVEARRLLEASAADLSAGPDEHWGGHLVARARAELAMTLAALGEPAERVAPIAELAHAWLAAAGARVGDVHTIGRLASP